MFKLILALLLITCGISAQQTVGVFSNLPTAYNGYTLFAPMRSQSTYLINNCGEQVHRWDSDYSPGLSAYLLENGNLLRTRNLSNPTFTAGGTGGGVELLDQNSNVVWEYTVSSSLECQHHDVEYMPNGNLLIVVWDSKTASEASQAGRITSGTTIWSEKIIEVQPDLINGGGTIVWEWNVWDHLIQDADNTKDNYGVIADSPGLINLNYYSGNPSNEDWLHVNSIDYNAALDQIILSSHSFSEVWVVDHSTTTLEASLHTGGEQGKGGGILYRWGNPQAYDQGTATDQQLYKQHDAYWIEDSLTNGGKIMIFNNQAGTPQNYSAVNVLAPPVSSSGSYTAVAGEDFGPLAFDWTYSATIPTDFYASNISGAQRLPNGNTLICNGPEGRFFEVNPAGDEIVWEYVNPINGGGVITQGNAATQNTVFRCYKYASDYLGLQAYDLTSIGTLESGSTDCSLHYSALNEQIYSRNIVLFPNPANNVLTVNATETVYKYELYTLKGELVKQDYLVGSEVTIDISEFKKGLYFIGIYTENGAVTWKKVSFVD